MALLLVTCYLNENKPVVTILKNDSKTKVYITKRYVLMYNATLKAEYR